MSASLSAVRRLETSSSSPLSESCRRVALHTAWEIASALGPILDALPDAGFSPKETFGIRLALEEALVNAIRHGHDNDPAKLVQLRYQLTKERFLAEVEDEGRGFDPHQAPDPFTPENQERDGGRGLFLMRYYMTWVRYNTSGTSVTLCKERRA